MPAGRTHAADCLPRPLSLSVFVTLSFSFLGCIGLNYDVILYRHVVLVSADKDGYVPPQSARVQMCDASIRDAEREVSHGQVRCHMTKTMCIFYSISGACVSAV